MTSDPADAPNRDHRALYLLSLFALVVAAGLLLREGAVTSFAVTFRSMEPTLTAGDYVVGHSIPYWGIDPDPGDLVTFHPPRRSTDTMAVVKRVVAAAGQLVEVRDRALRVDGEPVAGFPDGAFDDELDIGPARVPPNHVWVLGDNVPMSEDSRAYGVVLIEQLEQRVWFRLLPWSDRCTFVGTLPGMPRCDEAFPERTATQ